MAGRVFGACLCSLLHINFVAVGDFMRIGNWWGSAALSAVFLLSGCASMESHDNLATKVEAVRATAGPEAALKELDASATSADARAALLFNMERGELLRQNGKYKESTVAWLLADSKVNEWESKAKTDPSKLFGMIGAAVISERLKPYEGQDYEKVWLTTRLAFNRIAEQDWDTARVDIKRTHEREAVIAEFRAKETVAAEEAAKSKGAAITQKELNGYPVQTLNDPDVLKLRNGYQNALSHYLAGFLYEVLNEPGLAAPGYNQAIQLQPDSPLLDEGLKGLDNRTSFTHKRKQRMTDVLFVIESGNAPARKPMNFPIPVPINGRINSISISYPVIDPSREVGPRQLTVGTTQLAAAPVVDLNVMARRALKDDMPGMVVRGITRAIAKGVFQDQMNKQGGAIVGLLATVASVATEQADDRIWRTLPGLVTIARGYVPEGEHKLQIDGRDSGVIVKVQGQYALVPLRVRGSAVSLGEVAMFGQLQPVLAAAEPAKGSVVVPTRAVVSTASTTASTKPAAKAAAVTAVAQPAKPVATKAATPTPATKPVAAATAAKPASAAMSARAASASTN